MAIINAHSDGQLDFDALIASIRCLYPNTTVTVTDYWAERIASLTATARAEGWPVPNPSLTCSVLLSEENGLERQITIPMREGLAFTGRVNRHGGLFMAMQFSPSDVVPLVELLVAAGLRVEVVGAR